MKPTADTRFHFGVWLETPPYMPLTGQGIVQLLLHLARAAAEDPRLRVTMACAPWAAADLRKLAGEFGIPETGFQILTTSRNMPVLLRRQVQPPRRADRWWDRGRRQIRRTAGRIRRSKPFQKIVSRGLATDSKYAFLAMLGLAGFLALPAIFLVGMVVLASRFKNRSRRLARRVKGIVKNRAPGVSRALQFLRSHTAVDCVLNHEYSLLAKEARRLDDVRVWFVPVQSSRVPELGSCPLVVAVPDTVYVDFPTAFPIDWIKTTDDRIKKLARAASATISYSEYIRDKHVVEHLEIPRERTFVIPHAHGEAAQGGFAGDQPLTRDAAWGIVRDYMETTFRSKSGQLDPADIDYLSKFPFHEVDYIFVSSQIRPHKNLLNVITAFETLLRRKYLNIKLVTTGDFSGHDSSIRELLCDRLLQWDVLSLPQLPPNVHAAFYRLAKLTVISSLFEGGFPFPFSESLGVGTPVVMGSIPVTRELMPRTLQDVMLFDPFNPDDIANRIEFGVKHSDELLRAQRPFHEMLRSRTWSHVIKEYVDVFRYVSDRHQKSSTGPQLKIAEMDDFFEPDLSLKVHSPIHRPQNVFLFLTMKYWGGVWESTRSLVQTLVEINRERQEFKFTLGVHADQTDLESLQYDASELKICRFESETEIRVPGDAEVGFALVDRFLEPLQSESPYGVLVYDMIQRHFPQAFPKRFFEYVENGMRPTIKGATLVVTTSQSTANDVCAEYGLPESRTRVVPVACEPHARLGNVVPEPVALVNRPFLLYPANAATHKGAEQVLRGYAELKQRLGADTPMLVQCGFQTEALSPTFVPLPHRDDPQWKRMRELVISLELQEGHDVLFLGQIRQRQLRYLMENASVVINGALHDNGSFCIIEGRYFGRPVVSSRYSAAVELYDRFEIPVRFFEPNDPQSLATELAAAIADSPATGPDLEAIRLRLAHPRYSLRHFGEQFYNLLLELAEVRRNRRSA